MELNIGFIDNKDNLTIAVLDNNAVTTTSPILKSAAENENENEI